jgi:hypothetical protein
MRAMLRTSPELLISLLLLLLLLLAHGVARLLPEVLLHLLGNCLSWPGSSHAILQQVQQYRYN